MLPDPSVWKNIAMDITVMSMRMSFVSLVLDVEVSFQAVMELKLHSGKRSNINTARLLSFSSEKLFDFLYIYPYLTMHRQV